VSGRGQRDGGLDPRVEDSLSALGAASPGAPPIGDELARELEALRPVRTRAPRRQLAGVMSASLLYATGLIALAGLRRDLGEQPAALMVGFGLVWLLAFAAVTWLVVVPPRGAVIPRWRTAAGAALGAAVVLIASGLLLPHIAPSSTTYEPGARAFFAHAGCIRWGVAGAALPVVLAALAVRGAIPVGSRWAAAAVGAAGGALGGLVLHLHCPIAERLHVGLVHGGLVVIAAVVAALAARVGASRTSGRTR